MIGRDAPIDTQIFNHRESLKRFYNTDTGIHVLSQKILMSGLLSEITSESDVIAHNLCIKELEEIGILDEEALKPLLKFLLGQVFKRPVEGELDGNE